MFATDEVATCVPVECGQRLRKELSDAWPVFVHSSGKVLWQVLGRPSRRPCAPFAHHDCSADAPSDADPSTRPSPAGHIPAGHDRPHALSLLTIKQSAG